MNYGAAVWGYKEFSDPQVLQNRVGRFYLGVNMFTPTAATWIELDWMDPKYCRWLEMVRYKNHLVDMNNNRLPVKVYKWDLSLKLDTWAKEVNQILVYCNMLECAGIDTKCHL